jgi:hypothetical protein
VDENLVDIVFWNFDSKSFNTLIELMYLNLLIIILIKEQECFGQALELFLNLNSDQCHDLAEVALVIVLLKLLKDVLLVIWPIFFVGAHDEVKVL